MNSRILQWLVRWVIMALGVTLATKLVTGIRCDTVGDLIAVVLLLSLFNTILRPLLLLFTLPFIIFTLGFGILVINALLFLFVGKLVSGFHVAGFWPALWGALIVSITNWLLGGLMKPPRQPPSGGPPLQRPGPRERPKPDDVIDV
jgi:putative membrane protein